MLCMGGAETCRVHAPVQTHITHGYIHTHSHTYTHTCPHVHPHTSGAPIPDCAHSPCMIPFPLHTHTLPPPPSKGSVRADRLIFSFLPSSPSHIFRSWPPWSASRRVSRTVCVGWFSSASSRWTSSTCADETNQFTDRRNFK